MPTPSFLLQLRSSPLRHGLAAGAALAAVAGAILLQTPRAVGVSKAQAAPASAPLAQPGEGVASIDGQGLKGTLALSHRLALGSRKVYAELKLRADSDQAKERAKVSLIVALDTSGSMMGDKIKQAKEAAVKLVKEMRDDDEIAFLKYSSDAQVLQPLARVGDVRGELIKAIERIEATGGTNIPAALDGALAQISKADQRRARRLLLISDGIDSGQAMAEGTARRATEQGITVSSLGIGLDFNENYMSSVARVGRGNFAFVKEGSELAGFLKQELEEGASTVVNDASVVLRLPAGVTLGQVAGATPSRDGNIVALKLGSMFAGEERRVVLELNTTAAPGQEQRFEASASWGLQKTGDRVASSFSKLSLVGTSDEAAEGKAINGAVLASSISALASLRQLEAADSYLRGDSARAQALVRDNVLELQRAQALAPAALAGSLGNQAAEYESASKGFSASPASDVGKAAAKRVYHQDVSNLKSNKY